MANGFHLGDEVTLTATIMKVLPAGLSSVNIPSYNYPFAIDTPQKAKPGDKVVITGFVTRIDDEEGKITVRTDGGGTVTVDSDIVASDRVQVTE
ncbi:hypothetical protein ACWGTI_03450 [Mesorhizobium sp. ArgA1]